MDDHIYIHVVTPLRATVHQRPQQGEWMVFLISTKRNIYEGCWGVYPTKAQAERIAARINCIDEG